MNKGVSYRSPLKRLETLAILHRVVGNDKSVIEDCIDTYGNVIWALAKRYTSSAEEAEKAVLQIFKDIWKNASQFDSAKGAEEKYILRIAVRHLIEKSTSGSVATGVGKRQNVKVLPFYQLKDS
jgi:RNA polymerase sigma-70 factor (ECF subfamily)